MADHQPSLFSAAELSGSYLGQRIESPKISSSALQMWKERVFRYQQEVKVGTIQQGTLFDQVDSIETLTDRIDPFKLPQQNTEFWRWKATDAGVAALYFVIDCELPILLYVGETVKSNLRWKGEHDCKRYILNYISAHRSHQQSVTVNIGFWSDAPTNTRDRQQLESALILKWRSPFNKENWTFWSTPFTGGK